ncbi:MAG: efflux RND transporter periplasmic adaptor subunit [Candidatus Omnitrophica bacterium]|nr:efflux RND transporter periplasmic adaptor subunit [Candidatus Omnitrophota bacterium]
MAGRTEFVIPKIERPKKPGGNFTKQIMIGCALVAIFILLKGCFAHKAHPAMPPKPVAIATAVEGDAPIFIDSFGTLTPPNNVDIKSQVTGAIKEVNFCEGCDVKAGELIVTIDPESFKADLARDEASLAADTATLKLKESTLERNKKLYDKQLISQQDFDTYSADYASAKAKTELDAANVKLSKINLEYCYIKSPIDGVTGKRQVDPGNIVQANNGPVLVNIKTIDTLYVDFTVTEAYLSKVRTAMQAGKLKVEIHPADNESAVYSGELVLLDNGVDNTTGTFMLRAVVPNAGRKLWAGQFVDVRLILGVAQKAVLVPYDAVQLGLKGPYMFAVTPEGKADLRQVKTGQHIDGSIVIEEGVKAGEKVVTSGQLGLASGMAVMDVEILRAQKTAEAGKGAKNAKNVNGK